MPHRIKALLKAKGGQTKWVDGSLNGGVIYFHTQTHVYLHNSIKILKVFLFDTNTKFNLHCNATVKVQRFNPAQLQFFIHD